MRHRDVHFACESLLQQLVGAGYILLPGGGEPENHIVDEEGSNANPRFHRLWVDLERAVYLQFVYYAPALPAPPIKAGLGKVNRPAPAIASVQHPYQSALHNAPLAASPAASTTEMAGLANIVTPGTKLNTVCSPSKPTRAAGHELQNRCRTSSGPFAVGWLLSICCWSSLITSAGITVVDCAIAVLRLYGIASASCHPPLSGRMPT
jgi:hypothetical protein